LFARRWHRAGFNAATMASMVMALPAARMGLLSQAYQGGRRRVREVIQRRRAFATDHLGASVHRAGLLEHAVRVATLVPAIRKPFDVVKLRLNRVAAESAQWNLRRIGDRQGFWFDGLSNAVIRKCRWCRWPFHDGSRPTSSRAKTDQCSPGLAHRSWHNFEGTRSATCEC
jgi:hypothetical protein